MPKMKNMGQTVQAGECAWKDELYQVDYLSTPLMPTTAQSSARWEN